MKKKKSKQPKKNVKKNIIYIAILTIVAITTIFVVSPIAKSNEFHRNTIRTLEDKKMTRKM